MRSTGQDAVEEQALWVNSASDFAQERNMGP